MCFDSTLLILFFYDCAKSVSGSQLFSLSTWFKSHPFPTLTGKVPGFQLFSSNFHLLSMHCSLLQAFPTALCQLLALRPLSGCWILLFHLHGFLHQGSRLGSWGSLWSPLIFPSFKLASLFQWVQYNFTSVVFNCIEFDFLSICKG